MVQAARRIRGLDADERRAQRRDQLLAAALDLFADNGYQATSIEQICQSAYVGTKAFYELFDSKEACYIAVLEQATAGLKEQVVLALQAAPPGETNALPRIVATFARALVNDPRIARATIGQSAGISPAVAGHRRENRRWAAAVIESLWRQYDENPEVEVDYRTMAIGTVGGMYELIADWIVDVPDMSAPDAVDALIADLTAFSEAVRRGISSGLGSVVR